MSGIGDRLKKWRLISNLAVIAASIALAPELAWAQSKIVPDASLGDESSQVKTNQEIKGSPAEVIEGGAQRGANLFHSFDEFNVDNGRGVYFSNPTGIENIFTRVTGANASEILGTLGVNGGADLFLINPNGIIFGENARLDVGGSFIGTTADEVRFGETGFSASQPETSSLLTVNPSALFFNAMGTGEIINRSQALGEGRETNSIDAPVGLQVFDGNTLALVGGDVFLEGGNLTAGGGRIELGSMAGTGEVNLSHSGNNWKFEYDETNTFKDIRLQDKAFVDAGGMSGGNIQVQGKNVSLTDASAMVIFTSENHSGEEITIGAEQLNLREGSFINSSTFGTGRGANITIQTEKLHVEDGAGIATATYGQGQSGNSVVNASDSIELTGVLPPGEFPSNFFAQFLEGIEAEDLPIPSTLGTVTFENGNAGDLLINTSKLVVRDGAVVNAGPFSIVRNGNLDDISIIGRGQGGNLAVKASESIELSGTSPFGIPSGLFTQTTETNAVGNLTVETDKLLIRDGAVISASTLGQGDGGDLNVTASDSIELKGTSKLRGIPKEFQIPSSLLTQTENTGAAGNLTIETDKLLVRDGAVISASTLGQGDGGNLDIIAFDSIELDRANGLYTLTKNTGSAGNLTIATEQLSVQNGTQINVSSESLGKAGDLEITADSIRLDRQASVSSQTASEPGGQGNIILNTKNLFLRRESEISTNATGSATGGNITINADDGFIIAVPEEDSDITANAVQDRGGRIFINATGLYGIEPSQQLTSLSDITASSKLGSELGGTVEINTPDVERDRDLVQLPTQPIETKIVRACERTSDSERSEFVIKGRGGLPASPENVLDSNSVEADWVTRPDRARKQNPAVISNTSPERPTPIVEAQKWVVDDNHEIVLVADSLPNQSWQNTPQCQKKAEAQNYSLPVHNSDNILIASTEHKSLSARVPERIVVNSFKIKGNTVFEDRELAQQLTPFTNKPLSFSELLQARSAITQYYTERGYITSGAYIPLQRLQDKVVRIQIVEGYLEDIEITGNKRLNSDYLSRRLQTASDSLQQEELLSALQLLLQDPLIASLSAELEAGTRPGANVLEVEVTEADSFKTPVSFDNRRTPSVGSFRRQLAINEGNLFGFGDNLFLAYSNTEGSDAFDGSYAIPFNARNGTLSVNGGLSSSQVVESPFDQLNILGDSHYLELSFRQPVVQTPKSQFAFGITASRRKSDISSVLEEFDVAPNQLSPGADESGQTRVSALRLFQEWTNRNSREVIALRSQLNFGLDAFNSTVDRSESGPDSRFFAWQAQAQWARELADDSLLLVRGGIQLASTSLLSSEQFGLGGLETVRGYRQDLLLKDNAAFASVEVRLPIFRIEQIESVFQVAPFVDLGTAWNHNEQSDTDQTDPTNTLFSVGLGLRLLLERLTARLDYGIPLVSVDLERRTWQENGLHFSLEYNPF